MEMPTWENSGAKKLLCIIRIFKTCQVLEEIGVIKVQGKFVEIRWTKYEFNYIITKILIKIVNFWDNSTRLTNSKGVTITELVLLQRRCYNVFDFVVAVQP